MDDRLERFIRTTFRSAGRRYAEARNAYYEGRTAADLPRDDEGRVRIVCRREAERRAVTLDDADRPACYEAGHPDCEGCVEDVREGVVETW
jgi:hypothetical protein